MSTATATTTKIRPASEADAPALAEILNRIIAAGGTTAHQTPLKPAQLVRQYIAPERKVSCVVAVDETHSGEEVLGFQALLWPSDEGTIFPDGWAIIASFVDASSAGRGLGRKLFAATVQAARNAGVAAIDATIRADNSGGLAYYGALGFVDYDVIPAVPLRDGSNVDRIRKRFDIA